MNTWLRPFLSAFTFLVVYLLIATSSYSALEDWQTVDSLYFGLVTMSTVGYGDLSPSSQGARAFTIFMIFAGLLVFAKVATAFGTVLRPYSEFGRALLERAWPEQGMDIDGNGEIDFKIPRHPVIYYFKGLLPSLVANIFVQAISAIVFVAIEPNWTYGNAVYHCIVTATTVGYGDITIETDGGRLWACFQVLFSVVLLAELITSIDDLRTERAKLLMEVRTLSLKADGDLMHKVAAQVSELRVKNKSTKEHGLTESEFALSMLIELQIVSKADVVPFLKQFRSLTRSGRETCVDDELQAIQTTERQEKVETALTAVAKQINRTEMNDCLIPARLQPDGPVDAIRARLPNVRRSSLNGRANNEVSASEGGRQSEAPFRWFGRRSIFSSPERPRASGGEAQTAARAAAEAPPDTQVGSAHDAQADAEAGRARDAAPPA